MSEVKVKIEDGEKESVIRGSLATLLTAYGDSDDNSSALSESETENNDNRPSPIVKTEPPETLVENPAYKPKQDCDYESMDVKVKTEPVSEGEADCDDKDATRATDFGTLRKEKEGSTRTADIELSVDDFFPATESYGEARAVKVEVESGTSDSESDSDDSSDGSVEEDEGLSGQNDQDKEGKGTKKKPDGPKVKGELTLYDLPPIEDLHISVPHDECKPIGEIKSVVEPLVIVEAYPETPALDLDSVLFLEQGDRALGHVFDVIGPVKQPMYCVRFNSKEHIQKNKVEVGMPVYCAPKTPYTSYVFLAQLKRMKGSDASWLNDVEPPAEELEYSDDEMEKIAKKKKRNRNRLLRVRATEEDARHHENDETNDPQARGKKRNHNFTEHSSGANPSQGSMSNFHSNQPSAFLPPNVPGFNMYRPSSSGFPGYSEGWYTGVNNMRPEGGFSRHRGTRGRGFHHRLPSSNTGSSPAYPNGMGFHQNPYRQMMHAEQWAPGPWRPPPQWSNQNTPNFNFTPNSPSPYRQMFGMPHNQPNRTQPPPPPPPPGL